MTIRERFLCLVTRQHTTRKSLHRKKKKNPNEKRNIFKETQNNPLYTCMCIDDVATFLSTVFLSIPLPLPLPLCPLAAAALGGQLIHAGGGEDDNFQSKSTRRNVPCVICVRGCASGKGGRGKGLADNTARACALHKEHRHTNEHTCAQKVCFFFFFRASYLPPFFPAGALSPPS
jgi:hypothetical protein